MFGNRTTLIALGLVLLAASSAQAATPGEVLAGLQGWLDETRELEAGFEQELLSAALGGGVAESGQLFLSRPGRMRWDYLDPEAKVALIVGADTTLYLAEDQQLIRGRLDSETGLLPALLMGEGRLGELFEVELESAQAEKEEWRLLLTPVGAGEGVEEVRLTLGRGDYAIRTAEVLDPAGNRMLYRFARLRRNRGLPAGIFQFEPPPGTSILQDSE